MRVAELGSYLRLMRLSYHSTLGLRVMKKKREEVAGLGIERDGEVLWAWSSSSCESFPLNCSSRENHDHRQVIVLVVGESFH